MKEGRTYDTGKNKWTHGRVIDWYRPSYDARRWLLGPCPQCGSTTSNYGGAFSCHNDYCPGPVPDWWNTDIKLYLDGNQWCAARDGFVNLQESTAGFGVTPREAVADLLTAEGGAA